MSEDTDARIVEETTQKKAAEECDKNKALEMRKVAMERFGETRKRKDEDDESPISEKKCRRRTSSDTVAFLREKMEMDKENKKVEKEEREERRKEYQDCIKIFQSQINNQQQQQNALQQQMIAMFSQQTALIKALAEKTKDIIILKIYIYIYSYSYKGLNIQQYSARIISFLHYFYS